ncbi:hypothetical protein [Rhizobium leguminosarum]|uniref:hypothetical protein n=1 Tax=Rhizobium leguminosarum TaxID=384 RepID=UPI001C98D62B|nr:hypothetical protein [Rhizobium leguminosarum]MBY5609927.1 hypothetical protein [Rhizobium leguminosarum]MBY5657760.1 hypothetical protein [Rhizobium leguminosarum]
MAWKASIGGELTSASREEVLRMKRRYLGATELATRMSEMIWFDMLVHETKFGITPFEVLAAIREVEAGETQLRTKKASEFTRPPLKGLWHKHYFSARFLAHNILLGWGATGLKQIIEQEMNPAKSPTVNHEMIEAMATRAVAEPIERRFNAGKITGEWVVFAKNNGENYYLCMGTHEMGDQMIYDNIMTGCRHDFPDLQSWFG